MNPALAESLDRLQEHLLQDDRCLALVLAGSLGNGTADVYSDVDAVAVIRDGDYGAFTAELRPVLQRLCGPIVGWLPEGESADSCNYAFLYRSGEDLLLYDFYLIRERAAASLSGIPVRILFDRTGVFAGDQAARSSPLSADAVRQAVEQWWVYAYLNGKYLRRGDLLKLLYVQGVLLQAHVKVLNAAHCPERQWTWWARDLKELPGPVRDRILAYFRATDADGIPAALRQEMDLFSQDGRAACCRWNVEYHLGLESAVRAHLSRIGV